MHLVGTKAEKKIYPNIQSISQLANTSHGSDRRTDGRKAEWTDEFRILDDVCFMTWLKANIMQILLRTAKKSASSATTLCEYASNASMLENQIKEIK